MAVRFQLVDKFFEGGPSLWDQHFLVVAQSKPHHPLPPAGELQAAEAQCHVLCQGGNRDANGLWSQAPDAFHLRQSRRERLVQLAARHQPSLQIPRVRNGYPAYAPVQRVVFV